MVVVLPPPLCKLDAPSTDGFTAPMASGVGIATGVEAVGTDCAIAEAASCSRALAADVAAESNEEKLPAMLPVTEDKLAEKDNRAAEAVFEASLTPPEDVATESPELAVAVLEALSDPPAVA